MIRPPNSVAARTFERKTKKLLSKETYTYSQLQVFVLDLQIYFWPLCSILLRTQDNPRLMLSFAHYAGCLDIRGKASRHLSPSVTREGRPVWVSIEALAFLGAREYKWGPILEEGEISDPPRSLFSLSMRLRYLLSVLSVFILNFAFSVLLIANMFVLVSREPRWASLLVFFFDP